MTAICGGGGSDALHHAVRVARAYTDRKKILKFEGGYHGWHDHLAVSVRPFPDEAGPIDAPKPVPISAGALEEAVAQVVVAPFNDEDALAKIIKREKGNIAAALIEPVCHSAGCLIVRPDFISFLRDLCAEEGIVLIFDEVLTGFRHHIGGVQEIYGITPDLGAFGKAMANGFTISALAGKKDLMSLFTPTGPVYLSGTYMGNPIGVAASLKTIDLLRDGRIHKKLWAFGEKISITLQETINELELNACCYSFGSIWGNLLRNKKGRELSRHNCHDFARERRSGEPSV